MAKRDRLVELASERGVTEYELVAPLIERLRTPYRVAVELGVYPNSIYHWLKRNGYVLREGKWEPEGTALHDKHD